ncbi:MAG: DNA-binding response regulator [Halioglobus sp.]|nr:DNA-binding response regulator [Halioglobus sp.]
MNILLVDDEPLARERLQRMLRRLRPDATCLQAGNGGQALEQVAAGEVDLVLLDIAMPGMNGLEVAARLDELDRPPALIFCTAYDEHALQALRHQVVAYLLKPVREEDLATALDNAGRVNRVQLAGLGAGMGSQAPRRTRVQAHTRDGLQSLPVEDVRCFLAGAKHVTAHAPGAELVLAETLRELERDLGDGFLRVHRNALVALRHVAALQRAASGGWYLEMDGVAQRPKVSRRLLAEVRSRLRGR